MREKGFNNKDRARYYGLRVGDIVQCTLCQFSTPPSEVIGYGFLDNNRVRIKELESGKEYGHVAEWLSIVTKVEDRNLKPINNYGKEV